MKILSYLLILITFSLASSCGESEENKENEKEESKNPIEELADHFCGCASSDDVQNCLMELDKKINDTDFEDEEKAKKEFLKLTEACEQEVNDAMSSQMME